MADPKKKETERKTVQIPVAQVDAVNCPSGTNVKTVDNAIHSMVALFPSLIIEKNTLDAWNVGFSQWMTIALAIVGGDTIEIIANEPDEEGKPVVLKTCVASDEIPAFAEKEEKKIAVIDDKGNVVKDENGNEKYDTVVYVNHGQGFARSLPIDFLKLTDAFNNGVKDAVRYDKVTQINKQFRAGDGKRGRTGAALDISKLS